MARYYSFVPGELLFLYDEKAVSEPGPVDFKHLMDKFEKLFSNDFLEHQQFFVPQIRERYARQEEIIDIALSSLDTLEEKDYLFENPLFEPLPDHRSVPYPHPWNDGQLHKNEEYRQWCIGKLQNNIVEFSYRSLPAIKAREQLDGQGLTNPFGIVRRELNRNLKTNIEEFHGDKQDLVILGFSLIFSGYVQIVRDDPDWFKELNNFDPNLIPFRATPNWLFAGSDDTGYDQGSGGGPGTLPRPDCIHNDFFSSSVTQPDAPWNFTLDVKGIVDAHVGDQRNSITGDFLRDSEVDGLLMRLEEFLGIPRGQAIRDIHNSLEARGKQQPQQPVNVIVFDTAPPAVITSRERRHVRSLQNAYRKWYRKHPLLRSLLGYPTPRDRNRNHIDGSERVTYAKFKNLTIYYAEELLYDDPPPPLDYDPNDETYDVRRVCKSFPDQYGYVHRHRAMDHGTFVSGIIHTLCPDARIHLVQVLNDFAHGNLMLLARQMYMILDELLNDPAPIIMNMSLTFDVPLADEHRMEPNVNWDVLPESSGDD